MLRMGGHEDTYQHWLASVNGGMRLADALGWQCQCAAYLQWVVSANCVNRTQITK